MNDSIDVHETQWNQNKEGLQEILGLCRLNWWKEMFALQGQGQVMKREAVKFPSVHMYFIICYIREREKFRVRERPGAADKTQFLTL